MALPGRRALGGAALEGCPPRAGCGAGRTQVTADSPLGRAAAVLTLYGQARRGGAGPCTLRSRPEAPGNSVGDFSARAGSPRWCPQVSRTSPLRPSLPVETRAGPRPAGVSPRTPLQLPGPSTRGSGGREAFSDYTSELSVTQPCGQMVNLPGPFSQVALRSLCNPRVILGPGETLAIDPSQVFG